MKGSNFQPALLTRTEFEWLLNRIKVPKAYQYRIKSDIKKKRKNIYRMGDSITYPEGNDC